MNIPKPLARLLDELSPAAGLRVEIDPPSKEEGIWFVDLTTTEGRFAQVQYSLSRDFGVCVSDCDYDTGVDFVYQTVEQTKDKVLDMLGADIY